MLMHILLPLFLDDPTLAEATRYAQMHLIGDHWTP